MIPPLVNVPGSPWHLLPPGIHSANLGEIQAAFATNPRRRVLWHGLVAGASKLRFAGCSTLYLDGSYVTGKPHPNDFDACWCPLRVDQTRLDRVFLDFSNGRAAQKAKFKGEFFPSSMICADIGKSFLDFLQLDRFSGLKKGIISIELTADPLLIGNAQS